LKGKSVSGVSGSPHKEDKLLREIPRTKLQHHISREVRGIGFFQAGRAASVAMFLVTRRWALYAAAPRS